MKCLKSTLHHALHMADADRMLAGVLGTQHTFAVG